MKFNEGAISRCRVINYQLCNLYSYSQIIAASDSSSVNLTRKILKQNSIFQNNLNLLKNILPKKCKSVINGFVCGIGTNIKSVENTNMSKYENCISVDSTIFLHILHFCQHILASRYSRNLESNFKL